MAKLPITTITNVTKATLMRNCQSEELAIAHLGWLLDMEEYEQAGRLFCYTHQQDDEHITTSLNEYVAVDPNNESIVGLYMQSVIKGSKDRYDFKQLPARNIHALFPHISEDTTRVYREVFSASKWNVVSSSDMSFSLENVTAQLDHICIITVVVNRSNNEVIRMAKTVL